MSDANSEMRRKKTEHFHRRLNWSGWEWKRRKYKSVFVFGFCRCRLTVTVVGRHSDAFLCFVCTPENVIKILLFSMPLILLPSTLHCNQIKIHFDAQILLLFFVEIARPMTIKEFKRPIFVCFGIAFKMKKNIFFHFFDTKKSIRFSRRMQMIEIEILARQMKNQEKKINLFLCKTTMTRCRIERPTEPQCHFVCIFLNKIICFRFRKKKKSKLPSVFDHSNADISASNNLTHKYPYILLQSFGKRNENTYRECHFSSLKIITFELDTEQDKKKRFLWHLIAYEMNFTFKCNNEEMKTERKGHFYFASLRFPFCRWFIFVAQVRGQRSTIFDWEFV